MEVVNESFRTVYRHYKEGNLNWPMLIYISMVHIAAVIGVFVIPQCHKYTLLWAYILWPISGNGITGGVHRLWAHRSYKASFALRVFLMLSNSIANEGSIYHWSRDHRVHHKHSESDADPHNAKRGLFFSHMGWLLVKKHPDVIEAGKQLTYDDLLEDPVVVFQKNWDPWFALFMCFVFPGLVSTLWGENFWNGFWVAGCLRYAYVLHVTWFVNSAAHFYGDHPYDRAQGKSWPAENSWVSFFALGEGWHNWHHKYPYDYAASECGLDKQFNPTKGFIDLMWLLGQVWDIKRGTGAWVRLRSKFEADIYEKESAKGKQAAEGKKTK